RAASRATACASPRCPSRRRRVLHPGGVERRALAAVVVLRELEVVALVHHADRDSSDAGPRVEPGAQGVERPVVRGSGKPGEAECGSQELAALVQQALMRVSLTTAACVGVRLVSRSIWTRYRWAS